MLYKLLFLCAVLVHCIFARNYSLNARIEALAETFIIKDVTDVLRYAAYMKTYDNDLQVTFSSPIIGIRAIDDKLSIGLIANKGIVMSEQLGIQHFLNDSNLYAIANPERFSITKVPGLLIENQWIPHALFGIDVKGITLGFDLFLEYACSSYKKDSSETQRVAASATIYNPGVIISALLGRNDLQVVVKFGLAMPRTNVRYETDTGNVYLKSDKSACLEFGGETKIPVRALNLNIGTDVILEKYALESEDTSFFISDHQFTTARASFYIGTDGSVFKNGIWGALYTLSLANRKVEQSEDNWERATFIAHTFSCGIEKSWNNLWFFDKIFTRGGLKTSFETPIWSGSAGNSKTKIKGETTFNQVVPTIGIGVNKGIFDFDINVNLEDWDHLVSGPQVTEVTAGLRF